MSLLDPGPLLLAFVFCIPGRCGLIVTLVWCTKSVVRRKAATGAHNVSSNPTPLGQVWLLRTSKMGQDCNRCSRLRAPVLEEHSSVGHSLSLERGARSQRIGSSKFFSVFYFFLFSLSPPSPPPPQILFKRKMTCHSSESDICL